MSNYYITDDNVFQVECIKTESYSFSGEIFKVEKYDRYGTLIDTILVRFASIFLNCYLNQLGGSDKVNRRFPARPIDETETYRYAMRAPNFLDKDERNQITITSSNFQKLLIEEIDIDIMSYKIKKLVWRLFKNLPDAFLNQDDIFISTKFDFGEILLQLKHMAKDGYIKEFNPEQYEKDTEGFRKLEQELKNELSETETKLKTEKEDFIFVSDVKLKEIIQRDYEEVQKVKNVNAAKATIVLSGSLIEALLLDCLLKDEPKALASTKAPSEKNFSEWTLNELIIVARDLGIISSDATSKFIDPVRDFRNLIHPGKEKRSKIKFSMEEAHIAFQVLKIVIRDLKAFYS